jgi:hypothetical protein
VALPHRARIDPPLRAQAAFQHALGQLLDKQRHAIGALDDLADDLSRQNLAARDLFDQSGPITASQPAERQHADLCLAGPRWLELWAKHHDQQRRSVSNPFDSEVK